MTSYVARYSTQRVQDGVNLLTMDAATLSRLRVHFHLIRTTAPGFIYRLAVAASIQTRRQLYTSMRISSASVWKTAHWMCVAQCQVYIHSVARSTLLQRIRHT